MSGFSPDWLFLREPADHAARAANVAEAITAHFAARGQISVLDIGCGTGSNLRRTYELLPKRQSWLMIDYDPHLLEHARDHLIQWADDVFDDGTTAGRVLKLEKGERLIEISLVVGNIAEGIDHVLPPKTDLVTAAAFLDLTSREWIEKFVTTITAKRIAVFTPLIYDGRDRFEPQHDDDFAMLEAFHHDMHRDKGFGPALGPEAAEFFGQALQAAGYRVLVGDSPWELDVSDTLAIALAQGFAEAVTGTGKIEPDVVERWLDHRLEHGTWKVGHTDIFAVPRKG